MMTDAPSVPAGEQIIVPRRARAEPVVNAAAGTLSHIPERHYIIILSLSAGAIKMHFPIRKSAPKHVPLIFAASVCATFHTVFLVQLHTLTSISTSCSISGTACSYIHYTCRVQQVRAGAIPGMELSHNILLLPQGSHSVLYRIQHVLTSYGTSNSTWCSSGTGARRRSSNHGEQVL